MSLAPRISVSQRAQLAGALGMILLPAVLLYAVLFHFAVNIPNGDDYDAGLDYLNHQVQLHGLRANLSYLLAAQHNEYKVVLGHSVIWLQYGVFHQIDFRLLDAAGNLFVILIAAALWKMFLPQQQNIVRRLTLFIPVAWLVFQLDYAETLNWALPALQNVAVVFFALSSIYLLAKPGWPSFWGAALMLILSIAASGNGFMLVPIGGLLLALRKRTAELAIWLAATALSVAAYAYHYQIALKQPELSHSLSNMLLKPVYVIAFLGAALPRPAAAIALGFVLCLCFAVLARRGYLRHNPMVACTLAFILLTAIGVAGIRSNLGILSSISSRYRMYSSLLIILVWFAMADRLQHVEGSLLRQRLFRASVAAAILLSLAMDGWGLHYLNRRNNALIAGIRWVEDHGTLQPDDLTNPLSYWSRPNPGWQAIMRQSIELGIYRPPVY